METWDYEKFIAYMKRTWILSEHIGLVAPTGLGKTFIVRDLMNLKKHSVVIATKEKDKSLELYVKEDGFVKRDNWPPDWNESHTLLWRKAKELGNFSEQRILIFYVMNDLYKRGGYVLYFDDLYYVAITLGMRKPVQMMYTQVRSNGVSLISSMQRPTWVPLEAVSQSKYLLVGRIRSDDDIKRTGAGMGQDWRKLKLAIESLKDYEFLLLQDGKDIVHIQKRMR